MKKLKIGCQAGVFLVVVLLLWINFTPLLRTEAGAILEGGQKEFDARQKKYANDPETNIYLSSKFRELWCLRTELARQGGKIKPGPVSRTIDDFYRFHHVLRNAQDSVQLPSLTKDPEFLSSRQAFKELLPELEEALNRPVFVAPDQKADRFSLVPEMSGLEKAACDLALEAEVENFEQNPEGAWLRLKAMLNSSAAVGGSCPTLPELRISASIQSSACNSLYRVLAKHPKLSDDTLNEIELALNSKGLPPNSVARALEMELVAVYNTAHSDAFDKQVAKLGVLGQGLWLAVKGSGLANRELRLLANDWMSLIESARNLSTPDLAWTEQVRGLAAQDWMLGKHGFLAAKVIPSFAITKDKAQLDMRKVLSKIAAIQILVALERYHGKHGQFPKSLTELQLGPRPIDKPMLAHFHYSLEDGQPQLSFQVDSELLAIISDNSRFGCINGLDESRIQLLPYALPQIVTPRQKPSRAPRLKRPNHF